MRSEDRVRRESAEPAQERAEPRSDRDRAGWMPAVQTPAERAAARRRLDQLADRW